MDNSDTDKPANPAPASSNSNNTNIGTGDVSASGNSTIIIGSGNIIHNGISVPAPHSTPQPPAAPLPPSASNFGTLMQRYFSMDEFRFLCQQIALNVPYCADLDYEGLAGSGWHYKVLSLYDFCKRRRALAAMLALIKAMRDDIFSNYDEWHAWLAEIDAK